MTVVLKTFWIWRGEGWREVWHHFQLIQSQRYPKEIKSWAHSAYFQGTLTLSSLAQQVFWKIVYCFHNRFEWWHSTPFSCRFHGQACCRILVQIISNWTEMGYSWSQRSKTEDTPLWFETQWECADPCRWLRRCYYCGSTSYALIIMIIMKAISMKFLCLNSCLYCRRSNISRRCCGENQSYHISCRSICSHRYLHFRYV